MFDYENEIDYKSLRFVLYARKSTTDESRQIKSIEDQIAECLDLSKRVGFHVVGTLKEEKSAKLPNQRPVFRRMIQSIRDGKYDAILAWHPDRLARNMLEGGEIIDLIDQNIIKDLKFVTHHFSQDANGKMLFGMAFVLSKQYSDKLSQDVTRGVRSNHLRGKAATFKHGYKKDDRGLYVPDDENFKAMQKAWEMRKNGSSIVDVVNFLKSDGYRRVTKKNAREIFVSKQQLSNIFSDPFYYGLLVQAGKKVDLRELYDFKPVVSEDAFNMIQAMTQGRSKTTFKNTRKVFYPLRGLVVCGSCGNVMTPYSPSNRRVMYYRCTKKECQAKKKDVRAKVVFDYIYKLLEGGLGFTEDDYRFYLTEMNGMSEGEREELEIKISSKQGAIKHIKSELKRIALALPRITDERVKTINQDAFQDLQAQEETLESDISELKAKIPNVEEEVLSQEDFLNTSENAELYVKKGNEFVKDTICRMIFLNITLKDNKVATYQLKEPFATSMKRRLGNYGRGDWTRTSDLVVPNDARYHLRYTPKITTQLYYVKNGSFW